MVGEARHVAAVLACVIGTLIAACNSNTNGPSASPLASLSVPPSAAATSAQTCPNPGGGACLGPLAVGTYTTALFQPALTYSVPAGWDNEEDLPGNFLLLPPGASLGGVDAGTSDYIGVYTQVAPNPACGPRDLTPGEIASCIATNPDLETTEPTPADIGGLSGFVLDVTLAAGTDGGPLMVGVAPSGLDHGLIPGLTIRLYLLALGNGSLAIEVDDVGDPNLADYSGLVGTFVFGT